MAEPITSDKFSDPFRFLDAKRAEYDAQRKRAWEALKECGWALRPNHPVSMVWRARRWTDDGTLRLSSPTCDGLIELVRAEAAPRIEARRARKEAAEKKKTEKSQAA